MRTPTPADVVQSVASVGLDTAECRNNNAPALGQTLTLQRRPILEVTDARRAVATVITDCQTSLTTNNDAYQVQQSANVCQTTPTLHDDSYQITLPANDDSCQSAQIQTKQTANKNSSPAPSAMMNDCDPKLWQGQTSADRLSKTTCSQSHSSRNLLQNNDAHVYGTSDEIVSRFVQVGSRLN